MQLVLHVWGLRFETAGHAGYRIVACEEKMNSRCHEGDEQGIRQDVPESGRSWKEYRMRHERQSKRDADDKIQEHEENKKKHYPPGLLLLYVDEGYGHFA
jgi:hypothetical protein